MRFLVPCGAALVAALLVAPPAIVFAAAAPAAAGPNAEPVPFDSGRWNLQGAEVAQHAGREALAGNAWLADTELTDGVIEVDVYASGATSYPGITFHMESPDDCEYVYLRPHRPPQYGDAVQYAPVLNGVGGWQLYNGPGWTAGLEVPRERWFRLRVEVLGARARVFVDDAPEPALSVEDLARGATGGAVGLRGPRDGSAWFADFRVVATRDLAFAPPVPVEVSPGLLTEWALSPPFAASTRTLTTYPGRASLDTTTWRPVAADARGLVDVARHVRWRPGVADAVWARAIVRAEDARTMPLDFGYSDVVAVFLNGRLLFGGVSLYRSRDPSFLGIVGFNDTLYLPLAAGENELLLGVAENFGGWGFTCRDGEAVFAAAGVREAWRADGFPIPESAVYDAPRDAVYVSNYDPAHPSGAEGLQAVSRLSSDGRVLDREWVRGLRNPTGLAVRGDRLFVVERGGVAEAEIATGAVVARHALPGARFPNDVAVDADGRLYVTDTAGSVVYRLMDGAAEAWLRAPQVRAPNGVAVEGDRLVVGHDDGRLTAFDLATGAAADIARLPAGMIDGLVADGQGGWLVSQTTGRLYRIGRDGSLAKLLDVSVPGLGLADFAWVPGRRLAVVPGLRDGDVRAYVVP